MKIDDFRVRLGACGTVRCEPEWSWHPPAKSMDDFDLWFVWSGSGTLKTDAGLHQLRPGSIFLLRPFKAYHGEHDPRNRLGVCYLHFDFIDRRGRVTRPPESRLPPLYTRFDDVDFYERVLRQASLLVNTPHDNDLAARAQAEHLLRSVLLAMNRIGVRPTSLDDRAGDSSPAHVDRFAVVDTITRHIRENPGELFSIESLARRAGYSVDHFTRLFTRVTSMTPKEFCIRVRLDRARQLLRESAMSVEAIAHTLGYADVFFFSRQFKQRIGIAPSRWRAGR